jgi:pyruvate,orthophosphate dikinase
MVRSSVEMEKEELISRKQALLRITPESLAQMLFPRLDPNAGAEPLAKGLPASPGATSGHAIFDADRAEQQGKAGKPVILVREETKPEDIHGFFASRGILTSRGGKTSHAAVVARGMGKPCVAGAEGIEVNVTLRQATIGETIIHEGDIITIDGTSGMVYLGVVATLEAEITAELNVLLAWADKEARLAVMANADTPDDAKRALQLGAKGIGLCRTERMFNASDRLPIVLEMIIAEDQAQRQQALDRLLPIQRADFKGLLKTMAGLPVTIRLLDPPIHEFLPVEQQLVREIEELRHLYNTASGMEILSDTLDLLQDAELNPADAAQIKSNTVNPHVVELAINKKQAILKKVRVLHEVNPMLGHRGVRLGITFPEIYLMQIRALAEATVECVREGLDVHPEIMVPQVCTSAELRFVKGYVDQTIAEVEKSSGIKAKLKFGTMIEVVRACLRADSLAKEAEFFSFGTNDLTQATFSFSREDAENKFLPAYIQKDVLHDNPFEVLDIQGVGRLMKLAIEGGRATKPELKIGICGEHGGHPASIRFCHQIGLDYVSCSAPRVPIARLAAAHAKLSEG